MAMITKFVIEMDRVALALVTVQVADDGLKCFDALVVSTRRSEGGTVLTSADLEVRPVLNQFIDVAQVQLSLLARSWEIAIRVAVGSSRFATPVTAPP